MKPIALVLALLVATPAAAQVKTQAELNQMEFGAWKQADAAMTAQWRQTLAAMKGRDAEDTSRGGGFGYAASLLTSQRAWLKFRDAQCVIESGEFAGGSAQPMIRAGCLRRLTEDRTRQLKDLMWQR